MSATTVPNHDDRPLTALQKRWLELFLDGPTGVRFNARKAAIAAGYSEASAHNLGSRNNRNPRIRAIIDARLTADIRAFRREMDAKNELDARRLMQA